MAVVITPGDISPEQPTAQEKNLTNFTCAISTPSGGWLDLNDTINYRVTAESFNSYSQSWRRTEVTSPWIAGKYLVHAVPDAVEEGVSVYVMGTSQTQMRGSIDYLIACATQLSYQVRYELDEVRVTWDCLAADFSVEMSRELLNNAMATVKLSVTRQPQVFLERVAQ
jgi:hypothetical protein